MPIFDLECPKCGVVFKDYLLDRDEEPPVCGARTKGEWCDGQLKKLLSAPNFAFGRPRGRQATLEWAGERRAEMMKRSDAYDKTPRGRNQRNEAIARAYGLGKKKG